MTCRAELQDALRQHRIINVHDLAKAHAAAISDALPHIVFSKGGTWDFTGHQVLRSGYRTDPDSAYPLDRNKRFRGRTASGPSLDQAKAWADSLRGSFSQHPGGDAVAGNPRFLAGDLPTGLDELGYVVPTDGEHRQAQVAEPRGVQGCPHRCWFRQRLVVAPQVPRKRVEDGKGPLRMLRRAPRALRVRHQTIVPSRRLAALFDTVGV
ncbi:hypothetical protein [Curtobacterium sp. VKM Ac-2922]|uniref:hypothetical protein n=1 Tax=Curtobacterium sp. VKM Ac-2922 TaxID=2929475 RepID=UPI001FB2250C|nr:hypothetical protein [Curtobacterium sp. VKM Ac-2922]MCJ1712887.1 hypothetical protein [Curtobacterium sp. VKM Ac-2922]